MDEAISLPAAPGHPQGAPDRARTRDGRELYLCTLPGPADRTAPTVVFEAGMGAARSSWALVQAGVAAEAPAVVYDRAGLGRSPADPRPRTLRRLADDLGDLLDHLGEGPFVLVGHSWGGPVVRVAAADRPDRVAGLVLVDPTDEACPLYFSRAFRLQEELLRRLCVPAARTGMVTRLYRPIADALPAQVRAELLAEGATPAAMRTYAAESAGLVDDLRALRQAPPDLGGLPVVVISGARSSRLDRRQREALIAAHRHRVGRSPSGRHVLAHNSGHLVPLTEPEVVVAEIGQLLRPGT